MQIEDKETELGAATRSWSTSGRLNSRREVDLHGSLDPFETDGTLDLEKTVPAPGRLSRYLTMANLKWAGLGALGAFVVVLPLGYLLFV